MAEKSKFNLDVLRAVPYAELFRTLGLESKHTRNGMYFSPFHNENTPSFHVDERTHLWCDHGSSSPAGKKGGDIITLVQLLKDCSFIDACRLLATIEPSAEITENIIGNTSREHHGEARRVIREVKDKIQARSLSDYAVNTRHIPKNILNRYCFQVDYDLVYADGSTSSFYAIGFPNIEHEWALRSALPNGKYSTGGTYSVITSEGKFVDEKAIETHSDRLFNIPVVVFEGFMDFLSYMAWNRIETPGAHVVVLNSISNAAHAVPFISRHDNVFLFLDNDNPGQDTAAFIEKEVKALRNDVSVVNKTALIGPYNDINEAWIAKDTMIQQEKLINQIESRSHQNRQAVDNDTGLSS